MYRSLVLCVVLVGSLVLVPMVLPAMAENRGPIVTPQDPTVSQLVQSNSNAAIRPSSETPLNESRANTTGVMPPEMSASGGAAVSPLTSVVSPGTSAPREYPYPVPVLVKSSPLPPWEWPENKEKLKENGPVDDWAYLHVKDYVDTATGSMYASGNTGNSPMCWYLFATGTSVEYQPSGFPAYIIVTRNTGSYWRTRFNLQNIVADPGVVDTVRWYIGGTQIGGVDRTRWWVSFNNLYFAAPNPIHGWEQWNWAISEGNMYWNSQYDTLRVGLQDTSAAIMWQWWQQWEGWNTHVAVAEKPEMRGLSQASLFPNPAGGSAILHYPVPKTGTARVTMYDASGQAVKTGAIAACGPGTATLDVRALRAGVYLVRTDADGFTDTRELVVQH